MPSDREYRRLSLKMGQSSLAREERKKTSFRESLDTLILGSLSTSIGVVVLIALLSGMVGRPVKGWNETPIAARTQYLIPTRDCGIAAVVGEILGLAGMLVAKIRRGAISPLSTLGTVISLIHMYLFFVQAALMGLL
jgi:hypothetical protein